MENEIDLSDLEPAGVVPLTDGLQQRRSSETRVAILEAAVDCLAELGYARLSTQLIAKKANLSRGAMLHHYATRHELIEAVIDYAFYRHMEKLTQEIGKLSESERTQKNAGLMLDWQAYLSREHMAYLELSIAARTDVELREIFLPRARRHDQFWQSEMMKAFPEWSKDTEVLSRSRKLVRAVMSGMILNRSIWDDENVEFTILSFLSSILMKVRDGELDFPVGRATKPNRRKIRK